MQALRLCGYRRHCRQLRALGCAYRPVCSVPQCFYFSPLVVGLYFILLNERSTCIVLRKIIGQNMSVVHTRFFYVFAVHPPPSSPGPAVCAASVGPPPNINQPPSPSPCHRSSNSPQSCSAKHQPPTFFHAISLLDVCYILRCVQDRWLALQKETKGTPPVFFSLEFRV